MGARGWGGGKRALATPLEFEKLTSYRYAAVSQNTLKFSLAPSALAIVTLYFSLKRREKRKISGLRLRRAEKWSIFCTARQKRVNFLKCWWLCPPLEKILRAPMFGRDSVTPHHRADNGSVWLQTTQWTPSRVGQTNK